MITTMKKLKSGYINGTRVSLGNMNEFLSTSCITNLSFLGSAEEGRPDKLNPQVGKLKTCIHGFHKEFFKKMIFQITGTTISRRALDEGLPIAHESTQPIVDS